MTHRTVCLHPAEGTYGVEWLPSLRAERPNTCPWQPGNLSSKRMTQKTALTALAVSSPHRDDHQTPLCHALTGGSLGHAWAPPPLEVCGTLAVQLHWQHWVTFDPVYMVWQHPSLLCATGSSAHSTCRYRQWHHKLREAIRQWSELLLSIHSMILIHLIYTI